MKISQQVYSWLRDIVNQKLIMEEFFKIDIYGTQLMVIGMKGTAKGRIESPTLAPEISTLTSRGKALRAETS